VVAKNWSSLLIEVTISKRLFVVMPEKGIFCEFGFPNGILWEFSQLKITDVNIILLSHLSYPTCHAPDVTHITSCHHVPMTHEAQEKRSKIHWAYTLHRQYLIELSPAWSLRFHSLIGIKRGVS